MTDFSTTLMEFLTLIMTSAQVVEMSVISNSPQDYSHPDDRTTLSYDIQYYCTKLTQVTLKLNPQVEFLKIPKNSQDFQLTEVC